MTDILLHTEALAEFNELRAGLEAELSEFESELSDYSIDTQTDLELLGEILATAKGHLKRTQALHKQAKAPAKVQELAIDEVFKPLLGRLTGIEKAIKDKVGAYHLAKERERLAAIAEASKTAQTGQTKAALAALVKVEQNKPGKVPGLSVRYSIDIEIENEDLVPDEWWEVDVDRIAKYARATNGEVPIPGVIYHKRPITSSSSK